MTLLHLLGGICFTSPPAFGMFAGRSAGAVGIVIGFLIGLGTGGLGFYTLKLTAEYSLKYDGKSLPQVVQAITAPIFGLAICIWIGIVLLTAMWLPYFITKFIIHYVAP